MSKTTTAAAKTEQRDATLTALALRLGFETTEVRNSDSLDFLEVHIGSLMKALRDAYEAGRASR